MCRLCAKRKEVIRGMKLEDQVILTVCHAVSAGYANVGRRADGLQNAALLLDGLHNVHDKCFPKQYCSSKRLRTLQGAVKQVEGVDGLSGKCRAQLKRLRNLLGMGESHTDTQQPQHAQEIQDIVKAKTKRKRDNASPAHGKQEKKSKPHVVQSPV